MKPESMNMRLLNGMDHVVMAEHEGSTYIVLLKHLDEGSIARVFHAQSMEPIEGHEEIAQKVSNICLCALLAALDNNRKIPFEGLTCRGERTDLDRTTEIKALAVGTKH